VGRLKDSPAPPAVPLKKGMTLDRRSSEIPKKEKK